MPDTNKIRELIDKLNYYTKLYDEGHPEISDQEWDNMYFELQKLENTYNIYFEDSPTQRINYQVVNQLNKIEHSHPMLSLDKTKDIEAIKAFIGNKDYIAMAKMDGLTCSLTYENGYLVRAETRGNGIVGEDILHNALQVKNIPNKISYKDKLVIDGEIICTYKDFFEQFANEYKNPRNFASGSIRLLDSKESAMRKLTFVAWDVIEGLENCQTLAKKLTQLDELNFTTVPRTYNLIKEDATLNDNFIIQEKCKELGYPIDGVVYKYNNCKEYEAAGKTDHHFKGGLALKFYDEEYETTLKDIEWTMGRTGQLTPVAIFEPIDIDGTEVSRASLHNISIMEELGVEIGCQVAVYKANMIIPQISKVIPNDSKYTWGINQKGCGIPSKCPICGGATVIKQENESKVLYCSNPACTGKLINRLDHFCGKKGLDIKGLSKATLEKLIDWDWIHDAKDIFTLKDYASEWQDKSGFGIVSVNNILNAIENSKNTTLDKIIAAAGIPEVGSRVAKDLASYYDSWDDFRKETDFTKYNGIGEIMNNNLLTFDYNEIDYIVKNYLAIKKEEKISNNNENKLNNLTFCITGKTNLFKNRTELQSFIEANGGKAASSVTKNVNYLINNDVNSTSSKNIRAKELDIKIIDEQTFLDMFDFQK